uniref:DNA-directed RNA polymerase n=1 Tax=viral metagenome TaxID=1070528 RepID=A0A6C0BKX0_9ZZZZ
MSDHFNWDVETWTTLDSYFKQNKILIQHQLDSYNNMVDYVIPQIIEKNNPITIADKYNPEKKEFERVVTISFAQTYLSKPLIHENTDVIKPLYPNEARLRGLTYAAPMFVDVEYTIKDPSNPTPEKKIISKIPFLKLPVMLHSKYCHLSDRSEQSLAEMGECQFDQGGYFVVNGGEKVIVSQERVAENQVFVWTPPKTTTSKYTHEAEIKTSIDQRFFPVKVNKVKLTKEPSMRARKQASGQGMVYGRTFHVVIPYIKEGIPLFIMFRALGVMTEQEMIEMILPDYESIGSNYTNFLIPSIYEARNQTISKDRNETVLNQNDALAYLAERLNIKFGEAFKKEDPESQLKYVKEILSRELFPHIGQMIPHIGQTFRKKAFFLGYMTRKLIDCYFGVRPFDDRDHYGNKRVDMAGPLLTVLFHTNFIKLISDLRRTILGSLNDPQKIPLLIRKTIQSCNIDAKIKYGLSTGNWNTQKSSLSTSKKGIAQVLNRLSFAGALSHTRRIQSPLERAGSKIVSPRRLHGTHYGMCCPNETPEGQQIGIVKNLSMQTHITIQTSDYPIRIILNKLGVVDLIDTRAIDVKNCTKIFVNGDWFGVIDDAQTEQLYHRLKILKRHGIVVPYISIAWWIQWREIRIQTDGGRYSRPLYIVEDGQTPDGHYVSRLLIEENYNTDSTFKNAFLQGQIKWPQFLQGLGMTKTATIDNGGVVEYLDTNEIETSMIAMTYADLRHNSDTQQCFVKYTHCEIHPMMMMGIVASMIPFSDHNQSPRNCYQCLWKEEQVIMADGTMKRIADVRVNDIVLTINPNTLEYETSKVINQYVKSTTKPMVKLTTVSGRTLVCTNDHPILTEQGWQPAGQLTTMDRVCTYQGPRPQFGSEYQLIQQQCPDFKGTLSIMGQSMFVPVLKIEPHDNVEIADITTESCNHSFITGNMICVHNSAMAKQSIGYYATNYNSRMDTMSHVLVYGHRPLVSTRTSRYVIMDKLPHGATAMLLYACYTG